ncbi:vWA domain-containing protein [Desulfoscipio gibsoniae]|uniref:VWA containing CoxE family protein n=1 Tax=Desulfoscipio gibsoniae DSM 7213 TaxID=767817 RepID=R4KFY8_9FIRM|nr:VWA domain-containing protein [Desulfoscipio gibsoniae]AGL02128.1 hypothetical protein Desgi_2724 [Desulfoscipio gibsoniae DSM 7213]
MFTSLFYGLRREGVNVALTEWLTLMEALQRGLANSSLINFYYLARSVLIKSETQYDAFDRAFLQCFEGIETPPEITAEVLKWLENALPPRLVDQADKKPNLDWSLEELKRKLAERLKEQTEQHHGGGKWIGTGGTSPFGHSGYNPAGVRIGGQSVNRSAVKVAAERAYRDFRSDETLTTRQFELALRKLRLLSTAVEGERNVLDLDATVDATGRKAGMLELVWARERKNRIKLLILMDSGGSMNPYQRLCSQLFNAANKSTHFRDLQFYYYHNCIYEVIFNDPFCMKRNSVSTYDFLRQYDSDYRLIMVGDASMGAGELLMPYGALDWWAENEEPGQVWMQRLASHFEHCVWLNPIPKQYWGRVEGRYTIGLVSEIFPMFELTLDGLNAAIKKLRVKR